MSFLKKVRGFAWRIVNPILTVWNQDQSIRNRKNLPTWKRTLYRLVENVSSIGEACFMFGLILFCALTVGLAYCLWWAGSEIYNTWVDYE